MPFDPSRPESIFEPGAIAEFAADLGTAYAIRRDIPISDERMMKARNLGAAMRMLTDAEEALRKDGRIR